MWSYTQNSILLHGDCQARFLYPWLSTTDSGTDINFKLSLANHLDIDHHVHDFHNGGQREKARVLDRVEWKRGQKREPIASRPSSFAMASASNVSNPTFLTENDIPGTSLFEIKPEELKISELKFWLKCRGDAGIRLKTKAELVKRVNDYIRPWFLGRTRSETAFLLLWTFY